MQYAYPQSYYTSRYLLSGHGHHYFNFGLLFKSSLPPIRDTIVTRSTRIRVLNLPISLLALHLNVILKRLGTSLTRSSYLPRALTILLRLLSYTRPRVEQLREYTMFMNLRYNTLIQHCKITNFRTRSRNLFLYNRTIRNTNTTTVNRNETNLNFYRPIVNMGFIIVANKGVNTRTCQTPRLTRTAMKRGTTLEDMDNGVRIKGADDCRIFSPFVRGDEISAISALHELFISYFFCLFFGDLPRNNFHFFSSFSSKEDGGQDYRPRTYTTFCTTNGRHVQLSVQVPFNLSTIMSIRTGLYVPHVVFVTRFYGTRPFFRIVDLLLTWSIRKQSVKINVVLLLPKQRTIGQGHIGNDFSFIARSFYANVGTDFTCVVNTLIRLLGLFRMDVRPFYFSSDRDQAPPATDNGTEFLCRLRA